LLLPFQQFQNNDETIVPIGCMVLHQAPSYSLHCALASETVAQCIVIGPVCGFVCGCVCSFVCLFVCLLPR